MYIYHHTHLARRRMISCIELDDFAGDESWDPGQPDGECYELAFQIFLSE